MAPLPLARAPGFSLRVGAPQVHRASASLVAPQQRGLVLVRAGGEGPRVTQGREYREDDGSMSTPGGNAGGDKPLYADEAAKARRASPPKDNMSPEMKKKLRQEYLGLGGSTNTAMGGNYFLYVILFVGFLVVASSLTGAL